MFTLGGLVRTFSLALPQGFMMWQTLCLGGALFDGLPTGMIWYMDEWERARLMDAIHNRGDGSSLSLLLQPAPVFPDTFFTII